MSPPKGVVGEAVAAVQTMTARELSGLIANRLKILTGIDDPEHEARNAMAIAALARVQLEAIRDARHERLEAEFDQRRKGLRSVTYEVISRVSDSVPSSSEPERLEA